MHISPTVPDSSSCRAVDCARQEWAQLSDVFEAIDSSFKNCVGAAIYGLLALSHRCAMPDPPSGGAKERPHPPLRCRVSIDD